MEKIYRDEEVLELVKGSYLIHDASITRFDIDKRTNGLCVDVYFTSVSRKNYDGKKLKVCFVGVLEYSFYWNAKHHFYNVERYKFFRKDAGFYISLDPADESTTILEEDQDIIISKNIEASYV